MLMVSFGLPIGRFYHPYYPPYHHSSSVAVGGSGGDGGDAAAQGANVVAGVGAPAVADSGFNLNAGYQTGGSGFADATVANGAAGVVYGGGEIHGDFDNSADGGDGGHGGGAYAH
ncbi:unnamed protein product [Agarophyton chilense]